MSKFEIVTDFENLILKTCDDEQMEAIIRRLRFRVDRVCVKEDV